MRRAIHTAVRLAAETFSPRGPVVEVGSLYLPGYDALCNLRPHFPERRYIGCDIRHGLGVDQIHDAGHLALGDGSVGTLLLLETLEHLADPQQVLGEARRVLDETGLLLLSVPFSHRLHGFPSDYWRFTASGIHALLGDFPDKLVIAIGPRLKPAFIFAVARKTASAQFASDKVQFATRLQAHFERPSARLRGYASVLKERGRDFFGHLLGRAELSVSVFDEHLPGGYVTKDLPASQSASPSPVSVTSSRRSRP